MLKHCNELVRVVPFRTIYKKGGSTLFFEGGGRVVHYFTLHIVHMVKSIKLSKIIGTLLG